MSEATDRVEIADLIVRYALHFDRQEGAGFASIFTEDGVLVRPDGSTVEGREALAAMADGAPPMQHFPSPPAIDFEGEGARARSRVIALRADGSSLHMVTAGEYDDELVRGAEGWRIRRRTINAWLPAPLTNVQLAEVP